VSQVGREENGIKHKIGLSGAQPSPRATPSNTSMMLLIYVPAGRNIIPYLFPYRVKPVGYSCFGYPTPSLPPSSWPSGSRPSPPLHSPLPAPVMSSSVAPLAPFPFLLTPTRLPVPISPSLPCQVATLADTSATTAAAAAVCSHPWAHYRRSSIPQDFTGQRYWASPKWREVPTPPPRNSSGATTFTPVVSRHPAVATAAAAPAKHLGVGPVATSEPLGVQNCADGGNAVL
jgi:hypothetical protein